MNRQRMKEAYRSIKPDEAAKARMLENILSAASETAPAGKDDIVMHRKMKPAVLAAVIALMVMLMGCALSATWGTHLVAIFRAEEIGNHDFPESGYDIAAEVERVPVDVFSMELQAVSEIIKDQYKTLPLYSNWFRGGWQESFDNLADAMLLLDCDLLMMPQWEYAETSVTLRVLGNASGELRKIQLETGYQVDKMRVQLFADIYTEFYEDDVVIQSRTTEDVKYQESFYTTEHKKLCHIMTSGALESGYAMMDAFVVENGVLYNLHIAYLEEDVKTAERLVQKWANLFE